MVDIALTPTIQMASFGIQDSLFLMLLALVVFGPRRLPEIGRQIGKLMYEFRKVSNDFKFQMEEELRASEEAARLQKLQASVPAVVEASSQATLDVPPHPVSDQAALGTGDAQSGTQTEASIDAPIEDIQVPAVDSEVGSFPQIQPPVSGETIAAAKPFRGRVEEPAAESVTESGAESSRSTDVPVPVIDEGRIGTEVQPGISRENGLGHTAGSEQEAHHA